MRAFEEVVASSRDRGGEKGECPDPATPHNTLVEDSRNVFSDFQSIRPNNLYLTWKISFGYLSIFFVFSREKSLNWVHRHFWYLFLHPPRFTVAPLLTYFSTQIFKIYYSATFDTFFPPKYPRCTTSPLLTHFSIIVSKIHYSATFDTFFHRSVQDLL